ncbi:MAG: GAF domain-containing protein [Polyangiaceae bacterium]|nr:GAF domain-containing protein [Polyangiaceae bacterium]
MSPPHSPPRRSDPPPEELKREREDFLKSFFEKGAQITEELVKEREKARERIAALEQENATLRAHVASDAAIRDLLRKIEALEAEKDAALARYREVEDTSQRAAAVTVEIESELASVANLYVASFQLHSSLSPRGVMRHVMELLGQLIGVESFVAYLVDDDGARLVPVASEGLAAADVAPVSLPGSCVVARVFSSGEVYEARGDSREGTLADPRVVFPLTLEGRVVGAVSVVRTLQQKHGFVHMDQELFKLLGAQAVSALVAARLYTDSGKRLPKLSGFLDLAV